MESLREKIVRLSRELADTDDEPTRRNLKKRIANLKAGITPTEPKQISDFFRDKKQ